MKPSIAELRKEYARESLDIKDVARDPIAQFERWFQEALGAGFTEPNAMTLATADGDGRPSARIVLLKGFDARGFVFFTNYESRKGVELAENPQAALLFHWVELERQVRIEGQIEKVSGQESDDYYRTRPSGSRLGAWASPQSRVVARREDLEERWAGFAARYGDDPPRPAHWGGYRLSPDLLEFWQGRASRLHDRVRYRREGLGVWRIDRLAP
jgi:pyridoxamine 5'-phosphate oxidase